MGMRATLVPAIVGMPALYPSWLMAATMRSGDCWPSRYVTSALRCSKFNCTVWTPGMFLRALFTRPAHAAQLMPSTGIVTVFTAGPFAACTVAMFAWELLHATDATSPMSVRAPVTNTRFAPSPAGQRFSGRTQVDSLCVLLRIETLQNGALASRSTAGAALG
jgi:hypothetical protein